ncbi:MAG: tRNA 5'-guanylyltransferase [Armatimonadetes bacterium]|nr:tRNA 5'-guanylyltransferase [Armatimonadota bacterium]
MNADDFESVLRGWEYFHSLRLVPETWTVIRVDGRGFTRFTAERFDKPFDPRFRDLMVTTAKALLEEFGGLYAYTESDEISVLFPPKWNAFSRELEKIVSITAGLASATFTHAAGEPTHFDSRVWVGVNEDRVVDYFRWRQVDAARCALNGWCYWTLRKENSGVREATEILEGMPVGEKNELLFRHGINFNDLPVWQRRGIGLYGEMYEKVGYNPKTGEAVPATRRRVKVDDTLPMKDEYDVFLRGLLRRSPEPSPREEPG